MLSRVYLQYRNLVWCGLLLTFFSTVTNSLAQTAYYVANTGNDANDGLSTTSPVQSLSRVNSLMLQAGDVILFRRGDTFRGTLQIKQSGTAEKPIRFDAYGSGNKPMLAGSVPVRNWIRTGTNKWQAPCPDCGNRVTGLYANGLVQPLGRYPNPDAPNRGSLTVLAHIGATQLTSQETLTTDWTGGEAVVTPTYWIINRATITRQNSNTLTLNNSSTYYLTNQWGFFIQNHPATLDQSGEWYYNPTTQVIQLYYDQGNPNGQLMTATAADQALAITNAAFITIQNLHIAQARATNLYALNTRNLTLINDDFTDSGEDGIVIEGAGSTILIDNSTITDCNNNGFYIGAYQNVTFRNSAIRRIGLLPGRGKSGDGQFTGFQSFATKNTLFQNNVIDSIGYIGISVQNNSTIRQNLITNFCMTKSDGGGIYLWNGAQLQTDSIYIQSNIIHNGIGTRGALPDTIFSGAHGIFLDDCVKGADITDNTIMNCQGLGIYLHAVSNVNVMRNNCFNNSVSQLILYNYSAPCLPRNNTLKQNILVAGTASQPVVGYVSSANDLASFGLIDQNYYARPFNDVSTVRAVYNTNIVADLNLSQWQTQFGQDLNSRPSPLTFKDYSVKNLSNATNSSLMNNSGGWETWSLYNNGQANWSNESQASKGRLTISFSNSSGNSDSYVLAYKSIKSVAKSKTYLVRFSATASTDRKLIVFIRQRLAPYKDLTRRYEFVAGAMPKRYEFALTALANEADALLTFQLGEAVQPVWLDDISLQEAVIESVRPEKFIRLVYNPTTRDSVVVLNNAYRDVKNHYYASRVSLKPFTSVILLRDTLPSVDLKISLQTENTSVKIGAVTSVSLTVYNASANRSTLASQVQWSCQLPANLTLVNSAGLVRKDTLLIGTAQRLLTDTTFVFQVKMMTPGNYKLAAQVTETTYADPDSTPNSGTDDGEDDQTSLTLLASEHVPLETVKPVIVTAIESAGIPIEKSMIYPNPTHDEFMFIAEDEISTIRLVDLIGRERFSLNTVRQGQTVRFGQSLPDAYYLLYIQYKTGDERVVKLVKLGK